MQAAIIGIGSATVGAVLARCFGWSDSAEFTVGLLLCVTVTLAKNYWDYAHNR